VPGRGSSASISCFQLLALAGTFGMAGSTTLRDTSTAPISARRRQTGRAPERTPASMLAGKRVDDDLGDFQPAELNLANAHQLRTARIDRHFIEFQRGGNLSRPVPGAAKRHARKRRQQESAFHVLISVKARSRDHQ
jgi:hypothetical protein